MTEICVQVNDNIEKVKQCLEQLGYKFIEQYFNHDTYFTTFDREEIKKVSYKELLKNSVIIRNITGKNLDKKYIIYKNKQLDDNGNVIDEVKEKLVIDDIQKAKNIFSYLGLTNWCDYVNENNELKKGEVCLNIQCVKGLGNFIEVEEFETIKNKSKEEKFEILENLIKSFGLKLGTDFSCKKPFMLLEKNFQ